MFVILDERDLKQSRSTFNDVVEELNLSRVEVQLAEFVVVVKQETYLIVKDRFSGTQGQEYPLEELPEVIKQRLITRLKARDNVSTD